MVLMTEWLKEKWIDIFYAIIFAIAAAVAIYYIGKKKPEPVTQRNTILSNFSWEEIPGKDSVRFTDFLKSKYDLEWVKTAKIAKNDDGKTIMITAGKNFISLNLNNDNTELNLRIDNDKTDKFIMKTEKGKLNIYPITILARFILPDNHKINITDVKKVFGREDFMRYISKDKLSRISKKHFKIVKTHDGLCIEDLESTNGTRLNGEEIKSRERRKLGDGDEILVGRELNLKYVQLDV